MRFSHLKSILLSKPALFAAVWLPALVWSVCTSSHPLMWLVIALFCMTASWQDLCTRYFCSSWLAGLVLLVFCFWFPLPLSLRLAGLVPAAFCLILWKLRAMGSADLFFLAAFGWFCGLQGMLWIMTASCLSALLLSPVFERKGSLIPFASFLCLFFVLFAGHFLPNV